MTTTKRIGRIESSGTKGETTMNTLNATLKATVCGLGALAITEVMSWSFVTSTATAPGLNPAVQMAKLTIQQRHVWFGQSQPAVLVD
jgi:hypothetical protein